jgi:hypothetical protein
MLKMSNLIESIKLKGRGFGGRSALLILYLAGFVLFAYLSVNEYLAYGFSIVFVRNIVWICVLIVGVARVILRKPSTTSPSSENELNSAAPNSSKEIIIKNIVFFIILFIPTVFVLHSISHFSFFTINKYINISYANFSSVMKSIGELFIAISSLINLSYDFFVRTEAQMSRKITDFTYFLLVAASLLLLST